MNFEIIEASKCKKRFGLPVLFVAIELWNYHKLHYLIDCRVKNWSLMLVAKSSEGDTR